MHTDTHTEQTTAAPIGKAIAEAFVKAQAGFGPALKSSLNPHFRNKYADLAACVDAVITALNHNGIGLLQRTLPCDNGVCVETIFVHKSGETMTSGPLAVPAPKHDPQGYGSALTYARRYSLMAACGIAPEDDDGNAATAPMHSRTTARREPVKPSGKAAPAPPPKDTAAPLEEQDDRIPF